MNNSKDLCKIKAETTYLKSTCSGRSVTRCREAVPLGHYDGGNAENTYNGEVDKSRLRGTVERVVQPGHKGAHDQEGNARVVKSEKRGEGTQRQQLLGVWPEDLLDANKVQSFSCF